MNRAGLFRLVYGLALPATFAIVRVQAVVAAHRKEAIVDPNRLTAALRLQLLGSPGYLNSAANEERQRWLAAMFAEITTTKPSRSQKTTANIRLIPSSARSNCSRRFAATVVAE